MRTIYRYELPITDRPTIRMPEGATPLSVRPSRSSAVCIDLWVVVDEIERTVERAFHVVGTGNPLPDDAGRHIGTVFSHGGMGVWHVFEVAPDGAR